MSDPRPDSREAIAADLAAWLRQQEGRGPEWCLDEPSGLKEPAPVEIEAEAAPAPAAETPTKAAPAPAPAPTPAPEADPEFAALRDRFLADNLPLIRRHGEPELAADPLLAAHGGDKAAALAELRAEVLPCTACALSGTRKNTVFGAGNPDAEVVFIGEAPGQDEDLQGEPFVGRSGQLLTRILGAIGYGRDDVFICNILKCRPPNNRDPEPPEVAACEPHLKRQLAILQPKVICCLGRVAAQTLLGTDASLGRLRASVHFYQGVPVMATYHPAALLRNPSWKRETWNDVRKLRALADAI